MTEKAQPSGGLSPRTLLISSASAVVATLVVSQFWQAGTLVFTAMVPIVVGVVSEVLKRPRETIVRVAPIVAPRRGPNDTAMYDAPEETRRTMPDPDPRDDDDPFGLREPERGSFWGDRRVRIGLVTGLVAFLIGATVVTASELTLGGSAGGGDRRTTLLGGAGSDSRPEDRDRDRRSTPSEDDDAAAPTRTPPPGQAAPEATPTPQATPTPVTPEATPTPAPGATEAPGGQPAPAPTP